MPKGWSENWASTETRERQKSRDMLWGKVQLVVAYLLSVCAT